MGATKAKPAKARKKRKSRVEALLEKVRNAPSPLSKDPRQISFLDYAKDKAFAELDRAIAAELGKTD
jgi:hypothetical protein